MKHLKEMNEAQFLLIQKHTKHTACYNQITRKEASSTNQNQVSNNTLHPATINVSTIQQQLICPPRFF